MNILVTGATGNVGRIPFEYLSRDPENKVVGISSKTEGNGIVKFDLANANENDITQLIERNKINAVIHLAAIVQLASATLPEKEFTSSAIKKFLSNPAGKDLKYIVIGSVAEYGPQTGEFLDENTTTLPTSEYGVYKLKQAEICEEYRKKENLDITYLRLLNVIAPHLPAGPLVGSVFDALKKGSEGKISINSRDVERDFLDMRDFAVLLEKILRSEKRNSDYNTIYNVGSGKNVSYGKFIDMCLQFIPEEKRPELEVKNQPEPLNQTVAIINKVEKDFDWKPEHTLEESVKWCLQENNIIEKTAV